MQSKDISLNTLILVELPIMFVILICTGVPCKHLIIHPLSSCLLVHINNKLREIPAVHNSSFSSCYSKFCIGCDLLHCLLISNIDLVAPLKQHSASYLVFVFNRHCCRLVFWFHIHCTVIALLNKTAC